MAVKVVTIKPGQSVQGATVDEFTDVVHADGSCIRLHDDHLIVRKANGNTVAIHAPGRFAYGEVVEQQG